MIFSETEIPGVYIIDIDPIDDERGFFARSWCRNEFSKHGLNTDLCQCNISFNVQKGILRGLHFQGTPYHEAKLVRCTHGAIFDVAVDLRTASKTYKKWVSVELTSENRRMLYIPENFAHGYMTLEDNSEVLYQVSEFYHPEVETGIKWDDPAISIQWPEGKKIVSKKDDCWPYMDLMA